ncbi:hypothetical protein H4219_002027 [Mycoemilia scoparia]|uniref:DNA-directed RNA polymerase III subunit RPC4 n=1 Tax=Mycoemilia scoparia TaxID=417184 RepID=A0A9W8A7Z6_9FUNG|nr:hypothetical protein H4219_002027 [Mycoemilia scoparia]
MSEDNKPTLPGRGRRGRPIAKPSLRGARTRRNLVSEEAIEQRAPRTPSATSTDGDNSVSSGSSLATGRLASLRGGRGGAATSAAASKMRFMPVVPQRRVKKEESSLLKNKEEKNEADGKSRHHGGSYERGGRGGRGRGGDRGRGGNRGRGRDQPRWIQHATGPFAMGPSSLGRRSAPTSGGGGAVGGFFESGGIGSSSDTTPMAGDEGGPGSASGIKKTEAEDGFAPISITSENKEAEVVHAMKRLEIDYVGSVFNAKDEEEEEEEEDFEDEVMIFQLPGNFPKFTNPFEDLDDDVVVKEDKKPSILPVKIEDSDNESGVPETPTKISEKENVKTESSDKSATPQKKDVKPKITTNEGVKQKEKEKEQEQSTETRGPEGRIGTLQIYESGKVKMKIGDILYDISTGSDCQFVQKLCALDMECRQAFILGNIKKRLVCTPDLESMLQ